MQSPLTSFVGRDEDLSRVLKNLRAARLVTLTGPGGVGKTRLAIEASGRLGAAAWFVPLAPVTEPADVSYTVLDALGIREPVIARRAAEPGTAPLDRLAAALGDRDEVLILDNCDRHRGGRCAGGSRPRRLPAAENHGHEQAAAAHRR